MKNLYKTLAIFIVSLALSAAAPAKETCDPNSKTVSELYPNLASGVLTYARLAELPQSMVMKAPDLDLMIVHVIQFIAEQPQKFHTILRKNSFYALEQLAGRRFMLQLAKKNLSEAELKELPKNDRELINKYIDKVTKDVRITREDVNLFYQQHKAAFSKIPFERIKKHLPGYALKDKKQRVFAEYLRNFGKRTDIVVSASWAKKQAALAKDNVLDKARESGKPTLVIFSSISCCAPDEVRDMLKAVEKKYPDLLNVLHLDGEKDQIIAARYNIRMIPAQLFYDSSGKEFFRHFGMYSQQEVEKKLTEMFMSE
jgi:thioredoxin 1